MLQQQQIRYKRSLKASCIWMSVICCNMLAHALNSVFFYDIAYIPFFGDCIYEQNSLRWLLAEWLKWCILLIVILICSYVRGIGLFPITGYCSNTTSCTENHCELKSNKVCHCYRGKWFSLFLFFQVRILTFPGMLPRWVKCSVMYLCLTGTNE